MPGETRHSRRHRPPATYLVASDHKVQDHLEGTIRLQRGQLCREQEAGRGDQLWVKVLDNGSVVKVRRQALEELRSDLAALLEPVRDLEKRLKLLSKQHRLQRLLELPLGSEVSVIWNQSGELAEAELRYRGPLARGTSAVFFGVQLKGWAAGRGTCNGSHKGRQLFCCDEACGLFLPVSDLVLSRRDLRPHPSQSPASPEHVLPRAPAVPDERGASVPLSKVMRDTHRPAKPAPPPSPPRRPPLIQPSMLISARRALQPPKPLPKPRASSAPNTERWVEPGGFLEVGSLVEVNEPALFGVIRWIGQIPGDPEPVAGIELDQEMPAATDGTLLGERLFRCLPHKALFVKLRNCRRDSRFPLPEEPVNQVERCNSIAFASWSSKRVEENSPPPASGLDALLLYQGRKKGIQGHLNSCYLDASLFSMFSCSSSFDWLLFCPAASQSSKDAQDLLRCEIVNPLRRCGYVCASKTMPLRKLLKAETADPGFTSEEKDPEELLNQLFLLLKAEPLLKIRSVSQKEQECFIYQVFPPSSPQAPPLPGSATPPPHQTPPPTPLFPAAGAGLKQVASVQTLLESSFVHSGLKLTEAPSCLPLLMPRFGKEFKMFDAILPSLTLDLTDLLDQSLRLCSICQSVAQWECVQCYADVDITPGQLKQFCNICNTQVHSHQRRQAHSPVGVVCEGVSGRGSRQRMDLLAVMCIETSHYVSFVRHGDDASHWLFFDSMADREGGENGFNVPQVRACPELGPYLRLSAEEVSALDPASLPEAARRFLCDAYMCLYHCPRLALYK